MNVLDISKERLDKARIEVEKSPLVVKTPLLMNVGEQFDLDEKYFKCNVHFKLETLQKTGTDYSACMIKDRSCKNWQGQCISLAYLFRCNCEPLFCIILGDPVLCRSVGWASVWITVHTK